MVEIYRTTPQEAESKLPDLVRLLVDCVEQGASIGFVLPLKEDVVTGYWRRVISEMSRGQRIMLFAIAAERVVGAVQLVPGMLPNGRHRAEVQKLLVHAQHQRQGVGTQLMSALETAARIQGLRLLVLDTHKEDSAGRLYRRLGYQLAGHIPNYAHDPYGELHATSIFYKELN